VHDAIGLKMRVKGSRKNRKARGLVILQSAPQQFWTFDGGIIGKSPSTGVFEGVCFGELLSFAACAERGYRQDATNGIRSPVQKGEDFRGLVATRPRRGYRSHPRKAALSSCFEALGESLSPFCTRIPKVDLSVPPSCRNPAFREHVVTGILRA
jgi:hypothetical protein